ncbi:MAG: multifunctional CCA addition/repair protein [Porticoccaceae bacterium]|jgi:tRNA nucleotidyltransferase (CCA-adding enzyme)
MQIYLVGGAVRDSLINYPTSEKDWVVVGATPEQMTDLGYKPVGQDFPVFIHPKTGEEYALARTERKSGHGYKGFEFYTSTEVSLEEDLIRRDLTINAMAQDDAGQIIDPFGGQQDLEEKLLRHVSEAFTEDPLRVLRVARFAARYAHLGFTVAPETMDLMKTIVANGEMEFLVAERVWKETSRALTEQSPQVFIQVLKECNALQVLLPEVDALFGVPQRADFHPEIDTGIHTLMALEASTKLSDCEAIRFAVLVHDVGKAITPENVLPSHSGHEKRGLPLVKTLCDRLAVPNKHRQLAMAVTEFHLQSHKAFELKPSTLLKLFQSLGAIRASEKLVDFLTCCEADIRGRAGFEDAAYPSKDYLLAALDAVSQVDISDLVSQGVTGAEIGKQLNQRQIKQLTDFKTHYGK